MSNRSGRYQLYAWEVPTGELRQLTDRRVSSLASSTPRRRLLPGRHGRGRDRHLVRVPFGGGAGGHIAQSASLLDLGWRHQRNRKSARLLAGRPRGIHLTAIDLGPDGEMSEPRVLFRSERVMSPPFLSHQGDLAVVASAERSTCSTTPCWPSIRAPVSGWPSCGTVKAPVSRAVLRPSRDDGEWRRSAGRDDEPQWLQRPLIWRPRSGWRRDLRLDELDGDVAPLDWSHDGDRCCCCRRVAPSAASGSTTSPATHSTSSPSAGIL